MSRIYIGYLCWILAYLISRNVFFNENNTWCMNLFLCFVQVLFMVAEPYIIHTCMSIQRTLDLSIHFRVICAQPQITISYIPGYVWLNAWQPYIMVLVSPHLTCSKGKNIPYSKSISQAYLGRPLYYWNKSITGKRYIFRHYIILGNFVNGWRSLSYMCNCNRVPTWMICKGLKV